MADILIKGMEMPKNCFECPFMYARSYCLVNSKLVFDDPDYSELKGRYNGCPLVPIPEKHGRLIDADALNLDSEVEMADDWKTAHEIANVVKYAPTIVPAERT